MKKILTEAHINDLNDMEKEASSSTVECMKCEGCDVDTVFISALRCAAPELLKFAKIGLKVSKEKFTKPLAETHINILEEMEKSASKTVKKCMECRDYDDDAILIAALRYAARELLRLAKIGLKASQETKS